MKKNFLIIGAGIHGTLIAIELKKINKDFTIDLIEKNSEICLGSSAATHNRANRGFHYPRSPKTQNECITGWNFFKKNYKSFFSDISNSYYLIEKSSKINFSRYKNFLVKKKISFKEKYPKNISIKREHIEGCLEVFEGCFNHFKLKNFIKKKLIKYEINVIKNFNLNKVNYCNKKKIFKFISNNNKILENKYDYIINATYTKVDEILYKFNFKNKLKNRSQFTSIPIIYSKKKIPGITIMDGPYITIMPFIGKKNQYLLYDPENSVNYASYKDITSTKNYSLIVNKFKKYVHIDYKFKFKGFLLGNRPVPIQDKSADRSTKISLNKFDKTNIYTIREGKYISAPMVAYNFARKFI